MIALLNTFAILAVCYVKHQIDQMDSDILWHDSVQTTKQARWTLLPPSSFTACLLAIQAIKQAKRTSTLWHFYSLLYKLPNRPNRLLPSGTFTTCLIAKYQIGQTNFSTLEHLTALPLAISLGWVVTIDMDCISPRSWMTFNLYVSSVWSASIIATFVSGQLKSNVLWVWWWQG